ncbi:hypothetical protein G7Y89_g13030 [Cudoniella acicularis]|uniref:Enoyl reductase (ER) domain-containing protein n=1 Tax=Cudoniella acicularis TaxID=354080 RepID=A0A8H4R7N9_9HELO|nr:hypothetical protein G7Y89_g13030 [Cudoniella acicularis]
MKEVIVHPKPELWTEIHDVPIPQPDPDEVVIKVVVAGSNPKDWDHLTSMNVSLNSGDDIAGYVHALGSNVEKTREFAVGDRVAAFHPMMAPHGAFAEYAVSPLHTVLKLPDHFDIVNIDFRRIEAATLPLVITTAGITLFRRQNLPPPWSPRLPSDPPLPLIIYGASSALGTFAIKLARASNIHPIIAIAGGSSAHLLPLLDERLGDALLDYRVGEEEMKRHVKEKLNGLPCHHAFDAITSKKTSSWIPISQMLSLSTPSQPSYLSVVSGANKYDESSIPKEITVLYTYVGTAHAGAYKPTMPKQPQNLEFVKSDPEWAYVFFRYVARMLADGRMTGHPFQVVDGGLGGVASGLQMLKEGKARGFKFVFRVADA